MNSSHRVEKAPQGIDDHVLDQYEPGQETLGLQKGLKLNLLLRQRKGLMRG